jgi:hypothetical protein
MPEKRRHLEALDSIVSACHRDLHHSKSCTNGVRDHRTITSGGCQVPQEMGDPLSRRATSWPVNMGKGPCVFTATFLRQVAALHVFRLSESQIGPQGEAAENHFTAACTLIPLCCVRGLVCLDCHELPVVPLTTFQ